MGLEIILERLVLVEKNNKKYDLICQYDDTLECAGEIFNSEFSNETGILGVDHFKKQSTKHVDLGDVFIWYYNDYKLTMDPTGYSLCKVSGKEPKFFDHFKDMLNKCKKHNDNYLVSVDPDIDGNLYAVVFNERFGFNRHFVVIDGLGECITVDGKGTYLQEFNRQDKLNAK